jgi:hypothetical protein
MLAHERWKECVESLPQPVVLHRRLFPQRSEWTRDRLRVGARGAEKNQKRHRMKSTMCHAAF